MLAQITSSAVNGIDAYLVEAEVDISAALPSFTIVGLPDAAVRESTKRVRAAIKNCGLDFPARRITINLAPADVRKECPSFDLPIAVGILAATGQVDSEFVRDCLIFGELSLDGTVRNVSGIPPIASNARDRQIKRMLVPAQNVKEADTVGQVQVYPVHNCRSACYFAPLVG